MAATAKVCVGEIVGAHGVRGLVRLCSFTEDPAAVVAYGPLEDGVGRQRDVRLQSLVKGCWLARVEGINDRTAAEALLGTRLYVDRARLPEPEEEEFYHTDLIGLTATRIGDNSVLGTVTAIHDFGGGPMLELRLPEGRTVALPFTKAVVPVIEVAAGRILVDAPDGLLDTSEL